MPSNTTIKDIAMIANVSYSTVSRSLNNSPLVSEVTKKKVLNIAEELNFEFNANARGLILRKSNTIALVLSDDFPNLNTSSYQGLLLNSYIDLLNKNNIDLLVLKQNSFNSINNIVMKHIKSKKIDGIIYLSENPNKETLSFVSKNNFPIIFVHYPLPIVRKKFNVIYSDYYKGGVLLAKHLLNKGHAKFTIVSNNKYHSVFSLREKGFCDEISKHNGKINKVTCEMNFLSAYRCCQENMESIVKTSALFGITDQLALGSMKALFENKIKIPKDIAVVGYDNSLSSQYSNPSLTTVNLNREQMVKSCLELLISQINSADDKPEKNKKIILDPILIERCSS